MLLIFYFIAGLKQRGVSLAETSHSSCFCTTTPDNLFIFTCGTSNNSFQIHNSETGNAPSPI